MSESESYTFTVALAPYDDIGKDRVRLHWGRRLGKRRFVILRLTNGKRSAIVSALGHEEREEIIQMDLDLRYKLGVEAGQTATIDVSLCSWWDQLRWYLTATDPAVRIPALLGAWSFLIGFLSLFPIYDWTKALVAYVRLYC